MSSQRYSPEFNDEAVRQVVDHGRSIAEVVDRVGVSSHSLHKWLKGIKSDKTDEQAAQLLEAKIEILKLRVELRRSEEERDILKKAAVVLCKPTRVKYQFINEHQRQYVVAMLCWLLQVCRSGFYKWLLKPLSDRAIEDQRILTIIRASYAASHGVYGSPRVFLDLREAGETCGRHRTLFMDGRPLLRRTELSWPKRPKGCSNGCNLTNACRH